MSNDNRYDIIIFGTGNTFGPAHLILERGDYVPREKANSDPKLVNVDARYK